MTVALIWEKRWCFYLETFNFFHFLLPWRVQSRLDTLCVANQHLSQRRVDSERFTTVHSHFVKWTSCHAKGHRNSNHLSLSTSTIKVTGKPQHCLYSVLHFLFRTLLTSYLLLFSLLKTKPVSSLPAPLPRLPFHILVFHSWTFLVRITLGCSWAGPSTQAWSPESRGARAHL